MANDEITNPEEKGQEREGGSVKCLICGSDNTTVSGRQGMEKITKYFYPKAPYRCKECWGRFWVPDNPLKYTGTKVLIGCAVLLFLLAAVIPVFIGEKQETGRKVASRKIDNPPVAGPEKAPPAEMTPSTEPEIASVTEAVPVPPPPPPSSEMPLKASSASVEPLSSSAPGAVEPEPVSEGTGEAPSTAEPDEKQVAALRPEPASPAGVSEKAAVPTQTSAAADVQRASQTPVTSPSPTDAGMTAGGGEAPTADQSAPAETAPQTAVKEVPESADDGRKPSASKKQTEGKLPVQPAVVHKTRKKGALEKKKVRELTFIETGATDESVRLHIHGSGPIRTHRFFYMKSPARLVIDLPGAWKHRGDSVYPLESALAERVRVGGHPDFIRAVIDLKVAGPLHPAFTETEKGLMVEVRK